MLLSMTGFGEATVRDAAGLGVTVEVRSVNNRHFKLSLKVPDGCAAWEADLEAVVRQVVKRGTVQLVLRFERARRGDDYRLNLTALEGYRRQLEEFRTQAGDVGPVGLEHLLALPGVVEEDRSRRTSLEDEWPTVKAAVEGALARMQEMRIREGAAMTADLQANANRIGEELAKIAERAPVLIDLYRAKLLERLNAWLNRHEVQVQPADVVREVGMYAERSDISEEIVRLRSHLKQWETLPAEADSAGRKLDFLIQEMFRETNTIGSKSADTEISQRVIEMKGLIERLREMVQNVE